jgi:DNA-binding LytR/AlgR family response regulator
MNITCYIADDEFHAIEILKAYIDKTPGLVFVGSSTNPLEALERVTSVDPPMVTFLDVDMPELSGMEFAGMVSLYTKVIFTTSFPEYAIEAFEREATDYLLKPVSYERFLKSIIKVKKCLIEKHGSHAVSPDHFYIKSDTKGKMIRIRISDIHFVEAAQNYVRLHCSGGKYMAYLTMEEIAERLPKERFIRVHRSFMVDLGRITTVEQGQLSLEGAAVVPIGRNYKEALMSFMKESLIQSKRVTGG